MLKQIVLVVVCIICIMVQCCLAAYYWGHHNVQFLNSGQGSKKNPDCAGIVDLKICIINGDTYDIHSGPPNPQSESRHVRE